MTSVFELRGQKLYYPFKALAGVADDDGNVVLAYSMNGLRSRLMSRDHVYMVDLTVRASLGADVGSGVLKCNVKELLSALRSAEKKSGKDNRVKLVYDGGAVLLIYPDSWKSKEPEKVHVERTELPNVFVPSIVYDGHAVVGLRLLREAVKVVDTVCGILRIQISDSGLRSSAVEKMDGRVLVSIDLTRKIESMLLQGSAESTYDPRLLLWFLACFSGMERSLMVRVDVSDKKVLKATVKDDGWEIVYYQAPRIVDEVGSGV